MATELHQCPPDSAIHEFLESPLEPADIERHLNHCVVCQQRLQKLTATAATGWRKFMPDDKSISLDPTNVGPELLRPSTGERSHSAGDYIGRFEVSAQIGQGGMGTVFLATDPKLGRDVAIKLLTQDRASDVQWLERFRREARLAGSLNHPNVLTIYEIGEADGTPFIATEFVRGLTLKERLSVLGLSLDEALDYAWQLATGLAAAHAAGIVHRDLKPDNLMIRDDGLLKILDFGLARSSISTATDETAISESGSIVGTVSFMSPEQARGQDSDISSDVFSYGSVLFLMLAGERPFVGETSSDVMAAILTRSPKSIRECNAEIPAWLVQLVGRCLSKNPVDRPTSKDVAQELANNRSLPRGKKQATAAVTDSAPETVVTAPSAPDKLLEAPEIRYARSGDVNIAWQTVGDGPIDMVFVMGWVSHLEWFWKDRAFATFLRRLASFSRLILFDKRGTGLSDRVPVDKLPTLETRMDDVRAVMDAAGSERAVLCGVSEGGPLCALFAATYPQKTIAITMIGSYARRLWADDYPWGPLVAQREAFLEEIASNWGGPLGIEDRAPSKANDQEFRKWWATYLRMGASPGAAVALTRMNAQIDIRPILPTIQVPTLVLHRSGDRCLRVEEGRYMADLIPGAKFVELPGDDHLPFVGDSQTMLDHIEEFLTGMRQAPAEDKVLATVLHIRIEADSEVERDRFHALLRNQRDLFRGEHLTIGERASILTFDGPARAVRAANAVVELANRLGMGVCCGVDTGMCDIGQQALEGTAVETAGELSKNAAFSEVLVTETVMNLVSGSGLLFLPKSQLSDHGIVVFSLVDSC